MATQLDMTLRGAAWLMLATTTLGCDGAESTSRLRADGGSDGSVAEPDATVPDDGPDAGEQAGDANTEDAPSQDSGPPAERELFRSGTRLRAQGYRFDGPLLALANMHDSLLNTPCNYRFAEDGERYCMPAVEESSAHALPSYLDASCSQGALLRRADCAPPAPWHLITELACRTTTRVLPVAEASSQAVWYSKEPGGCVAHTLLAGQQLYPLGDALPLTTFVRGTAERVPQSGLSHERLVGSDGSLAPVGAHDPALGGSCTPLWLGRAGGLRCVASERAFHVEDGWFSNEQCTQPVAFALPTLGACREPRLALHVPDDALGCQAGGPTGQLFELGPFTSDVYTRDFDNACIRAPASSPIQYSFYELGAPAAVDVLPQVTIERAGTGRLRPHVWQGSEGQLLGYVVPEGNAHPLLFDTQLDSPCEPVRVAGEVLCAPPRASTVFTDAGCQQPLLEVFEGDDCALGLPSLVGVRGSRSDSCGVLGEHAQLTLHRVGRPKAPPATRHVRFQGSCVVASSPAIRARYFELGESLPSSMLARLEPTTE